MGPEAFISSQIVVVNYGSNGSSSRIIEDASLRSTNRQTGRQEIDVILNTNGTHPTFSGF